MDSKQPVELHHLHALSLEPRKLLPAGKIVYDLGDCGGVHWYRAEHGYQAGEACWGALKKSKYKILIRGASFEQVGVGSKHADQSTVQTYSRSKSIWSLLETKIDKFHCIK